MSDLYEQPRTPIHVNQTGYRPQDLKIAMISCDSKTFSIVRDSGETVYEGLTKVRCATPDRNSGDILRTADFSAVTQPGCYRIQCGNEWSPAFVVANDVYHNLTAALVKLFYYQRCGGDGIHTPFAEHAFAHPACHTGPAVYFDPEDPVYGNVRTDVSGGWHDAGDHGRYVTPAAKAVADLLLAYEHYPAFASLSFGCPHSFLDEVRYEIAWMLKMQHPGTGGVFHKVTTQTHAGLTVLPEDDHNQLYLAPVSGTATGNFAAVTAYAARVYAFDKKFSEKCLTASKLAWKWLKAHQEVDGYNDPPFFRTGKYGDHTSRDERYWAAAELYQTTCEEEYKAYLEEQELPSFGLGWADMGTYAMMRILSISVMDQDSFVYKRARKQLLADAQELLARWKADGYQVAQGKFVWGSNMDVANCAMLFLFADRISPHPDFRQAAQDQVHYLLGRNPMGISYVTGFGDHAARYPHHRASMARKITVPGMLVGGPNGEIRAIGRDPASALIPENTPPTKCYMDIYGSFALNEICIYWNSPLVYALGPLYSPGAI